MQTVSLGESLHLNPIFWNKSEKKKKFKISSVDFFSLTVQLTRVIIISVNI